MKLVLVEWVDSTAEQGWQAAKDAIRRADAQTLMCESVGWLLAETDRYLLLVPHHSVGNAESEEIICDVMQIPIEAVRATRTITAGRRR